MICNFDDDYDWSEREKTTTNNWWEYNELEFSDGIESLEVEREIFYRQKKTVLLIAFQDLKRPKSKCLESAGSEESDAKRRKLRDDVNHATGISHTQSRMDLKAMTGCGESKALEGANTSDAVKISEDRGGLDDSIESNVPEPCMTDFMADLEDLME